MGVKVTMDLDALKRLALEAARQRGLVEVAGRYLDERGELPAFVWTVTEGEGRWTASAGESPPPGAGAVNVLGAVSVEEFAAIRADKQRRLP